MSHGKRLVSVVDVVVQVTMDSPNGLKYARTPWMGAHVHDGGVGWESGAKEKLVFIKLLRCMCVCV